MMRFQGTTGGVAALAVVVMVGATLTLTAGAYPGAATNAGAAAEANAAAEASTAVKADRTPDLPLPAGAQAVMDKPQFASASLGLLQTDAAGHVVQAHAADQMFMPGSTAKLFSTSAAWKLLGADHKFTTPVYAVGSRDKSTLKGDLVLVGSGDLSLGGRTTKSGGIAWENFDHADANSVPGAVLTPEDPLAGIKNLAAQVRKSGITRVDGNAMIDDRLFHSTFEPDPTPVMINDNLIDLLATPTTEGKDATLTYRPHASSLKVVSDVKTVAAGQKSVLTIKGHAPGTIKVTGTIAADAKPMLQTADIADTASFARTVFIDALKKEGVAVTAKATGTNPKVLPSAKTYTSKTKVAAYVSPPYKDYAKLILKVSHNLGANLAVCLLAVQAGKTDCNGGFAPMHAFLKKVGVDTTLVAQSDGRGGVPVDRVSPIALTQLLRYWLTQPDFDAFRACLPILGVDGSLKDVQTSSPARGKVMAKTGTVADLDRLNGRLTVQTKSLAGFFQAADGSWQVFNVVVNNVVVNNAGGDATVQPILDANDDVGAIAASLWSAANP
ncbi:D-alanyl-D-alanine carboxypeptidase/D-alanyl-D-alanine endopeptidase [Rathayibacter soli]|uniref:D-alanyl-D-alanine carboxypeptidase/D-alanyl-D-alanine endopeptidase n=1 Tax=Rathayibacter soli TaxID=3144168 RepID=UPI0027E417EE|nr:D-alanyl-D-alanine carboxypeptidase/D-alanyl-D-alanine-endopeptidase [Glaciibacter superstes]